MIIQKATSDEQKGGWTYAYEQLRVISDGLRRYPEEFISITMEDLDVLFDFMDKNGIDFISSIPQKGNEAGASGEAPRPGSKPQGVC